MKQQKENRDLRIVFMGTPDFAVAGLAMLVSNGFTTKSSLANAKIWYI